MFCEKLSQAAKNGLKSKVAEKEWRRKNEMSLPERVHNLPCAKRVLLNFDDRIRPLQPTTHGHVVALEHEKYAKHVR